MASTGFPLNSLGTIRTPFSSPHDPIRFGVIPNLEWLRLLAPTERKPTPGVSWGVLCHFDAASIVWMLVWDFWWFFWQRTARGAFSLLPTDWLGFGFCFGFCFGVECVWKWHYSMNGFLVCGEQRNVRAEETVQISSSDQMAFWVLFFIFCLLFFSSACSALNSWTVSPVWLGLFAKTPNSEEIDQFERKRREKIEKRERKGEE